MHLLLITRSPIECQCVSTAVGSYIALSLQSMQLDVLLLYRILQTQFDLSHQQISSEDHYLQTPAGFDNCDMHLIVW
jgi:hypothetical protein